MLKRLFLCVLTCLIPCAPLAAQTPKVRISAWYWLNSAPKSEWQRDFKQMKQLGFTDVMMCWGLDLTGVVTRKHETTEAIGLAKRAGLGTYLIIWQPSANSLKRNPKYMQVDSTGKAYDRFDVFNSEWRNTEWKDYLTSVAKAYAHVPGFSGYVFDDSFGSVGTISYNDWEKKHFGAPLPKKPGDPRWDEWTKARQGWWADWGKDTVRFIRAVDPNRDHIIYVEDSIGGLTSPEKPLGAGFNLSSAIEPFDAVGGYTTSQWTSAPDSDKKVEKANLDALKIIRSAVGPTKPIIFTFWTANILEERKPGPAVHPTAKEIEQICQIALNFGVRHLDMYGYRIGEYDVTREQMAKMMPPEPAPYVVTGQFPHKFMWDRPEIHAELGRYLRSLNK